MNGTAKNYVVGITLPSYEKNRSIYHRFLRIKYVLNDVEKIIKRLQL